MAENSFAGFRVWFDIDSSPLLVASSDICYHVVKMYSPVVKAAMNRGCGMMGVCRKVADIEGSVANTLTVLAEQPVRDSNAGFSSPDLKPSD